MLVMTENVGKQMYNEHYSKTFSSKSNRLSSPAEGSSFSNTAATQRRTLYCLTSPGLSP